jgi:hypothetical protein
MHDAIEFPYRGWLIQVTFDEDGWSAKAKHPRGKDFATITRSFPFAADAIHAALSYVTWTAPSAAIHQALQELHQAHQLTALEYNALVISFDHGWRAQLSARDPES